jgi:TonB family protein
VKYYLFILIIIFLTTFDLKAQSGVQSSEVKEAEQLSAQVVKLYQARKFDEALPLAERALALREKALGAENELVAHALRNLAEVLLAKKRNKEAEATYDRYLSVYGKVLGENNSNFISALDRYLCLLVDINRMDKAIEIQKQLYKLDNKFDYKDETLTPTKNPKLGSLLSGKFVNLPKPNYPAEAKQAGISGFVIFKITVDETGKVVDAKALCGHPLLVKGAETTIRQTQYKPTIVSGQPVKVVGIAILNFVK